MAKSTNKAEPIVSLEKLRDNCVATALMIKKGELSPNVGNAMINAYRASIYAEQVRLARGDDKPVEESTSTTLSRADRKRLDEVARLLVADKEG